MAETEGKLLTCDLCGKTVFLKYVGDSEADGGFTRVRRYEDRPDGWQTWHATDVIHSTLCPSCNERMQDALLACINGIKGEGEDD
ncbi:MAG: hypothetical protein IKF78_13680 [Atopobiaceae bacterium]|nr:hypothetical protein [Atopobiaceae bacterium]